MNERTALLLASLFFLAGCATLHEQCLKEGSRYGGYDRCMVEKREEEARWARASEAFNQSLQRSQQQQQQSDQQYYQQQQQQQQNFKQIDYTCLSDCNSVGRYSYDFCQSKCSY